jgi:AcrR family transcriptional regulator
MKEKDLRVVKTKSALSGALMELLNRCPLDEIKVVDICELAMVHRTTFYKHFDDKYHLLNYVIEMVINELRESVAPEEDYKTPEEFYNALLRSVVEYIHKNRARFRTIVKNNMYGSFIHTMEDIICKHITTTLQDFEKRGYSFDVPIDVLARYRSGGLVSIAYYLLENKEQYSVDEICEYLSKM